jgi:hypothetical protein
MELCVDSPREGFTDLFTSHPLVESPVQALVKFAGGHYEGRLALPLHHHAGPKQRARPAWQRPGSSAAAERLDEPFGDRVQRKAPRRPHFAEESTCRAERGCNEIEFSLVSAIFAPKAETGLSRTP